jgi:hypothetical protein
MKRLAAFHKAQGLKAAPSLEDINAMHRANVEAGREPLADVKG